MIGGLQASGSIKMIMDIKNPEAVIASLSAPKTKAVADDDQCREEGGVCEWVANGVQRWRCCEGLKCSTGAPSRGLPMAGLHTGICISDIPPPEPKCKADGDTCWLGKDICCEGLECHPTLLLQGTCQPPYPLLNAH